MGSNLTRLMNGTINVDSHKAAPLTRRAFLLSTLSVAAAAPAVASPAILTGAGDVRMVKLVNPRTGDSVRSVYWIEGRYIPEVLAEINHLMRDWRADTIKPIAPELIDLISGTQNLLECTEPFIVYSGYRTPATNAMLRRKSRGVARKSYHLLAMAADLHLETRSVRQVAGAAKSLGGGGVGRYTRSDFTHLDVGPVRSWGR